MSKLKLNYVAESFEECTVGGLFKHTDGHIYLKFNDEQAALEVECYNARLEQEIQNNQTRH